MKTSLLVASMVLATALPLWACQSTNAGSSAAQSNTRDIYVGAQDGGNRNVTVPADRSTADAQAPYALRGDSSAATTANIDAYRRLGTNGS
jgi:hypothetical protein